MKHITTWKIKGRSDFAKSGSFFIPLLLHQLVTGKPELNARKGVDTVVDTGMERSKAAQKLRVCSIHDSINFERGDVALPEIKFWVPFCRA